MLTSFLSPAFILINMVNRVEMYIIAKDDGTLLYHYDLTNTEEMDGKDEIVSSVQVVS